MSEEILIPVKTKTPNPAMAKMRPEAARRFNKLREQTYIESGVDFLAVCGDVLRPANFKSNKSGVAMRSWHKTGRAFDYDQNSPALVLVSEIRGGRQYFRTYLKCARQNGSFGTKRKVKDMRGYTVEAYLFDFTAAAEAIGFERIPAWNGWQREYNYREFWHYQFSPDGITWEEAMAEIKGRKIPNSPQKPVNEKILGLNDRGELVRVEQERLAELGFLPKKEVDGVFGAKTRQAVVVFQKKNGLIADGTIGSQTRAKLSQSIASMPKIK